MKERKSTVCIRLWASGVANPAFSRAYSMDIENDDLAVRPPPTELLPVGADGTMAR